MKHRRNVNTELDYISMRVFHSALQSLIIIQTHQYHYLGLTTFSSDKLWLSGWNCRMQKCDLPFSGGISETCYGIRYLLVIIFVLRQDAQWHCVLAMGETVHPLHRPFCRAAAKLAQTCSATCWQWWTAITEWFTVSHIARFSQISTYVTIRSVKTHQWHEKLRRLLGDKLCRPPFPNIAGTDVLHPAQNRRPWMMAMVTVITNIEVCWLILCLYSVYLMLMKAAVMWNCNWKYEIWHWLLLLFWNRLICLAGFHGPFGSWVLGKTVLAGELCWLDTGSVYVEWHEWAVRVQCTWGYYAQRRQTLWWLGAPRRSQHLWTASGNAASVLTISDSVYHSSS